MTVDGQTDSSLNCTAGALWYAVPTSSSLPLCIDLFALVASSSRDLCRLPLWSKTVGTICKILYSFCRPGPHSSFLCVCVFAIASSSVQFIDSTFNL